MSNSISISITDFPSSLISGLACASLNPGLRSIVVFDIPYKALYAAASTFAEMLQAATNKEVECVLLGASELDDDLWGGLTIDSAEDGEPFRWRYGVLTAPLWESRLRIIVIPDITQLSVAAMRACVMLVGADVVQLERHGQHQQWHPELCWLVGCPRDKVGALSPHLLDRFSLRLQWQNIESSSLEGEKDLSQRIFQDTSYPDITDISSLPQMKERIQKASEHSAIMTKGAISAIQEYANVLGYFTHRREIALARLASSIAQLKLENQVTEVHVAAAARLIGLNSINDRVDETSQSEEQQIPPSKADEPENAPTENTPMPQQTVDVLAEKQQQVKPQDFELAELEEQIEIAIPTYPYPEDKAPVEREAASLQLPLLQHSESRSAQGVAIGVKRSNTLRDLAIVSTILAAAPFQRIRYNMLEVRYQQLLSQLTREDSDQTQLKSLILKQQHFMNQLQKKSGSRPFLLSKEDLRCYRRSPIANSMLVILLDYTCLRGCSWRQSLLPFLIRAYVERASIYIVRVGMVVADPTLELRAELVKARSILVPSVDESMIESQGKATPLAHGLEIVRQTFRHALQHGRSRVPTGLLVVITDGRGNVPLEDSQMGYITQPVSRKGIEDALKIAQQLRDFKKVEKILLNPQPAYYPDLPITLAEAMGADVENIPHLDEGNELEWNQSRV